MGNKYSRNNCGPDPESIPEQAEELEEFELISRGTLELKFVDGKPYLVARPKEEKDE